MNTTAPRITAKLTRDVTATRKTLGLQISDLELTISSAAMAGNHSEVYEMLAIIAGLQGRDAILRVVQIALAIDGKMNDSYSIGEMAEYVIEEIADEETTALNGEGELLKFQGHADATQAYIQGVVGAARHWTCLFSRYI